MFFQILGFGLQNSAHLSKLKRGDSNLESPLFSWYACLRRLLV